MWRQMKVGENSSVFLSEIVVDELKGKIEVPRDVRNSKGP